MSTICLEDYVYYGRSLYLYARGRRWLNHHCTTICTMLCVSGMHLLMQESRLGLADICSLVAGSVGHWTPDAGFKGFMK